MKLNFSFTNKKFSVYEHYILLRQYIFFEAGNVHSPIRKQETLRWWKHTQCRIRFVYLSYLFIYFPRLYLFHSVSLSSL